MRPPDPPISDALVGRDDELAAVLDVAGDDRPGASVVLVAGDAGIGKTRLLNEVSASLGSGRTVVHGRAWDEIECPPYWPWTSAMRELVGVDAADLGEVVLDGGEPGDRFELFDATAARLRQEAEESPVVVVLDDLHAADAPTLLLTRYLAREITDRPVTIVAAHRPVDPERHPEVHRHLDALAQVGRTLPLRGLAVDDVAQLLDDPELAPEVHELTGGNPLFVRQIRAGLDSTPSAIDLDDRSGRPPSDVLRRTIAERVARLSLRRRRVLAALAITGETASITDAARLLGRDADDVGRDVAALEIDGLVRAPSPALASDRQVLTHPLVREIGLAAVDTDDLQSLHLAAARLIGDDPRRRGERAQHLLRAGSAHVDDAVSASIDAADAAMAATAHEDAIAHCERALAALRERRRVDPAVIDGPERLRREADLWIRLGRACRFADRGADADEAFDTAIDLARRAGDHRLFALAALRGGVQYFTRHDRDPELAGRVVEALELLPDADDPLRARVLADLSARTADPDVARRLAADAVAMARRTGDPVALGTALIASTVADLGPTTLQGRLDAAREVLELARRADDPALAVHGRFSLFGALLERGDLRGMATELRALGEVDEVLVGTTIARFEHWMAFTRAVFAGDVERAEARAARALDLAGRAGDPWGHRIFGAQVGTLCWIRDQWSDIEGVYEVQHREHPEEPVWAAALAWIRAHAGRSADARQALAHVGPLDRLPHGIHQLLTVTMAAEAIAIVGDDAAASAARDQVLPYADRFVPINLGAGVWGPVARAAAALAARMGLDDEALAHHERAIAVCDRLGARPWSIDARLALAERLVELGRSDEPRTSHLVTAARDDAVALGLGRFVDRADALAVHVAPLRPVPVPAPDARRPRIAVLGTFEVTSTEGEVARWTSRKARELLKFLVAKRGGPVHREVVMDLLWPDVDPGQLANRYAVALSTIRRALDPGREYPASALLVADRDTVRLRLDEVDVDVEEFLQRATEALARHDADAPGAVDALVAAAELHPGPALPDEPYAEWARPLRDEVRLMHVRVVRALADRAVAAGDHLAAADAFRRLVDADPLDPAAHHGLTEALARLGAAAAADVERARFAEAARGDADRTA